MARISEAIDEKTGLLGAAGYYEDAASEIRDANRNFDASRNRDRVRIKMSESNGLTCIGDDFKRRPISTRRPRALGIFVAILLFLWWSLSAIPSLLSFNQPEDDSDATNWSFDEVHRILISHPIPTDKFSDYSQ